MPPTGLGKVMIDYVILAIFMLCKILSFCSIWKIGIFVVKKLVNVNESRCCLNVNHYVMENFSPRS